MNRVLVVGPPGAGKSTLARELGRRLDLPVIHLDTLFWKPGWLQTDRETFRQQVARLVEDDRWVMDGNYGWTNDLRVPRADTLIHLDFSTATTLFRILRRMVTGHGTVRSDGPAGCPERIDFPFIWWTLTFQRRHRPRTLAAIEEYRGRVEAITLSNQAAVDRFLKGIAERSIAGTSSPENSLND